MELIDDDLSLVGRFNRNDSTGLHEISSLLTDRRVLEEFSSEDLTSRFPY
jgi:hypothetical protein